MIAIIDPLFNSKEVDALKKYINVSKYLSTYYKNKKESFMLILLNDTIKNERLKAFKFNKKLHDRLLKKYYLINKLNIKNVLLLPK